MQIQPSSVELYSSHLRGGAIHYGRTPSTVKEGEAPVGDMEGEVIGEEKDIVNI